MNKIQIPEKWEKKNKWLDVLGLPLVGLIILNLPFIGSWNSLIKGEMNWIILVSVCLIIFSGWVLNRAKKIKYGYDQKIIYYQGFFKNKEIKINEIESIDSVHEMEERTWSDINPLSRKGRRVYVIKNKNKKIIIPQNTAESHFFAKAVEELTKLEIKNKPKGFFDAVQYIIGG
jgi:hypothetical protein